MAEAASDRNRPGWDQLISSWAALTGPIPGWASRAGAMAVTSWRSSASSCRAVLSGGQDPLGCHGHQPGAGSDLLAPGAPPEAIAQRFGGGDDQGLELAAGVRPGRHDSAAGGGQHPDRLAVPALAWPGEVVAGQGLVAGPDGVQGVALGPVAAPGPLGPVDLDHPLAMVDQEPGQPGPIAPGPFQGPDSPAWRLLVG